VLVQDGGQVRLYIYVKKVAKEKKQIDTIPILARNEKDQDHFEKVRVPKKVRAKLGEGRRDRTDQGQSWE